VRKALFIHIGAHKTGTTSLQHYFRHHGAELLAQGVLYPESCNYQFAQHRLAFALRGMVDPARQDRPQFEEESAALLQEISSSDCRRVLVSSEEFFSLPAAALARLGTLARDFEVHVIAVLRRPDRLFESMYNQMVKEPRNRFARPYQVFLETPEKLSQDLRFDQVLAAWAKQFGKKSLLTHCLEDAADVIDLIAGDIGVDASALPQRSRPSNASVSVKTAEIIRLGKLAGLAEPELRRIFEAGNAIFGAGDGSETLLSPSERLKLLQATSRMTNRVFKVYLKRDNIYARQKFRLKDFRPATRVTPRDVMLVMARLVAAAAGS
jgi:hypothetical protein